MTNLEEIEITIDPDGKTRVQVRGVPGPDCVALTAALEEKIGDSYLHRDRQSHQRRE